MFIFIPTFSSSLFGIRGQLFRWNAAVLYVVFCPKLYEWADIWNNSGTNQKSNLSEGVQKRDLNQLIDLLTRSFMFSSCNSFREMIQEYNISVLEVFIKLLVRFKLQISLNSPKPCWDGSNFKGHFAKLGRAGLLVGEHFGGHTELLYIRGDLTTDLKHHHRVCSPLI